MIRTTIRRSFRRTTTTTGRSKLPRLFLQALEERAVPATFHVTGLADSGAGSLRQAVLDANNNPGVRDTIVFDSPFFDVARTINVPSQISVKDGTTIIGPGSNLLTLAFTGAASTTARIFTLDSPSGSGGNSGSQIVSGIKFTGGNVNSTARGGAVLIVDDHVRLTDCWFDNNKAVADGGAVEIDGPISGNGNQTFQTVEFYNCKFTNNVVTGGDGGAFNMQGGTNLVIRNSVFSGNTASSSGGMVYINNSATLLMENCTVSGNTANGAQGGAIYFYGKINDRGFVVRNSTFANNVATAAIGGAVCFTGVAGSTGTPTFQNCTITGNKGKGGGGGLARASGVTNFLLQSTIVSGNTDDKGKNSDIQTAGTVTSDRSAIGTTTGITTFTDVGGSIIGGALNLQPLADNGGPTFTVALASPSAAINAGFNAAGSVSDQRGTGFTRVNGTVDIGAYEYVLAGTPTAKSTPADITSASTATLNVAVTYTDDTSVDASTINGNPGELKISGPGYAAPLGAKAVSAAVSGKSVTVTYTFDAPTGGFSGANEGTYTVSLDANTVSDGTLFVPGAPIATFRSIIGKTITVDTFATNIVDAGDGVTTLREAIIAANVFPDSPDTIGFDPTVFATPQTISAGGQMILAGSATIDGGVGIGVTVDGGGTDRLFWIDDNEPTSSTVLIANLTMTNGKRTDLLGFSGRGGAVAIQDEVVTFLNCNFTSNTASVDGGAVNVQGNTTVQFTNCVFTSNTVTNGALNSDGGAINIQASSTVGIRNCIISGNVSGKEGGGIYVTNASQLTVENSTISGNSSATNGGGIYFYDTFSTNSTLTIRNSTISGNNGASGGGVALYAIPGFAVNVIIQNSTIAANTATTGVGGGIARLVGGGSLTVSSSIVSGNKSVSGGNNINYVDGSASATINSSGIGDTIGFKLSGGSSGNQIGDLAALKVDTSLSANGGMVNGQPILSHLPLAGSTLRNNGIANGFTAGDNDVRGTGFSRILDGKIDIGAVESSDPTPTAIGTAPDVIATGATTFAVTVIYSDTNTTIKVSTIDVSDITVTGPGGTLVPDSVLTNPGSDASSVTATYTFTAPDGTVANQWDFDDYGVYTISLVGTVSDNDTPSLNVSTGTLSTFNAAIPQTFKVDLASDADDSITTVGNLTLREAIRLANERTGTNDSITFDTAVFNAAQTITMTTGTQMAITDPVRIIGPGSGVLTLDADQKSRIFDVQGALNYLASISGMTLTKGKVNGLGIDGTGGGIRTDIQSVTLTDVNINNCSADDSGGAIAANFGKIGGFGGESPIIITLESCVLDKNSATRVTAGTRGSGGAIEFRAATNLVMNNTTISGNTATNQGGGIYFNNQGSLKLTNSTISGNVSNTGNAGGIYFYGTINSGGLSIRNSTFSGNTAKTNGGGLAFVGAFFSGSGTAFIQNCTFTANTALGTANGGGLFCDNSLAIQVDSSIFYADVAGGASKEISSAGTVTMNTSFLGSTVGITALVPDAATTSKVGIDPKLDAAGLQFNGGPTKTIALQIISPAVDSGSNPTPTVTYDQRGAPFVRSFDSAPDVGAYELQVLPPPIATATAPNVTTTGGTTFAVTVVYVSSSNTIDVGTIGPADITVTGPGGTLAASSVVTNPLVNASSMTATYTFTAPGGAWDTNDYGTYTVNMIVGQVTDLASTAVPAGTIGSFQALIATSFLVDEVSDVVDGNLTANHVSLREAIAAANARTGTNDTISFAPVFGTFHSIVLTAGQLAITDPATIVGPGSDKLTLDAAHQSRLFDIQGATNYLVSISGMTLTNGYVVATGTSADLLFNGSGGGIRFDIQSIALTDMYILNCDADHFGGGIAGNNKRVYLTAGGESPSTVTLDRCVIANNTASKSALAGARGSGGGIEFFATVNLVVLNTTISGNTGTSGGGIYFNNQGSLQVQNSTISGNVATGVVSGTGLGGGVYFYGTINSNGVLIRNSTIASNSAATAGGGIIFANASAGIPAIQNSTFTKNAAGTLAGGAIAVDNGLSMQIDSCILYGDFSGFGPEIASAGGVTANLSLIGDANPTYLTNFSPDAFTQANIGVDPLFSANGLKSNGGPTNTIALQLGSPAIDNGSNLASISFDQRGAGFAREVASGKPDIGAYEFNPDTPDANIIGTLSDVTVAVNTAYSFQVTYSDDVAINVVGTLGVGTDIRIIGPRGFNQPAIFTSVNDGTNGTPRIATFEFSPPNGRWNGVDNGTYYVVQQGSQVADTSGNFVPSMTLASFNVFVPFVVDEVSDVVDGNYAAGKLSLREAVIVANSETGFSNTINFDSIAFGSAQTITMALGQCVITNPVVINGPTAALTLDAGALSRVVSTAGALPGTAVTLNDLRMTNGKTLGTTANDRGGAILIQDESVTLNRCVISKSTTQAEGGGIAVTGSGSLIITNSTIADNTASTVGGGLAQFSSATGAVSVKNSTISGNIAQGKGGGGVYFSGVANVGGLTITNSTLSGNTASTGAGGGVLAAGAGDWAFQNSTVANNVATTVGGGIARISGTGALTLSSTLVASNSIGGADSATSDLSFDTASNVNGDNNLIRIMDPVNNAALVGSGNLTGDTTTPLDAKLGALANNGGTTKTHALLPGSPAINKGNDNFSLGTDQRGGTFSRVAAGQADIGAFEAQLAVASVQFGDGSVQRSMVKSVVITFSTPVTFTGAVGDAFTLFRHGTGGTTGNVTFVATQNGAGNVVTLDNFTGALSQFGSLIDGFYDLTIDANQINFSSGSLDGQFDTVVGGNYVAIGNTVNNFFRLYGDGNGDAIVNQTDFIAFRNAFNAGPSSIFDFEGDGNVTQSDFIQFRNRFNLTP